VETPSIEPRPEIRGPPISMLTQLYIDSGDDLIRLTDTDLWAAMQDLVLLFLLYVNETEHEHEGGSGRAVLDAIAKMARMFVEYVATAEQQHGGDFREFLQEQALEAFGGDGGEAAPGVP
jgi:hypothetical protein